MVQWAYVLRSCGMNGIRQVGPMILAWLFLHFLVWRLHGIPTWLYFMKSIGKEARFRNKSVLLGPRINVYRTPLCGRNFEYMGEDPYLISRMVVPYV